METELLEIPISRHAPGRQEERRERRPYSGNHSGLFDTRNAGFVIQPTDTESQRVSRRSAMRHAEQEIEGSTKLGLLRQRDARESRNLRETSDASRL